ncbi:MAG: FAD-binding oxidoreductase [Gammaproteobacteria bacterium]|nr:MAG: FAD-binding oxidoreductase [Gammaproteobacteria bacterium]
MSIPKWQEKRSFWTWGFESDEPDESTRSAAAKGVSERFGREVRPPPIPKVSEIELRKPRLEVPSGLAEFVSSDHAERVLHTHGGHPLELLSALRGQFESPPDAVAHPRTEDELEAVLAWCDEKGHTAIPYGGATSVVWGVCVPESSDSAVTIDLDHFHRVLEIDPISRAARIQAGVFGPDLENALRPEGLTLRHFPQSFPWSTVGGWVATRSGGHYATNHTHIDDFVESIRMLTPAGWWESRRLPGSGAGPSPDRMVMGSEGVLGVISECWLRLQRRPVFRATAGVAFDDWSSGADATRQVVQAKLWPANLRLLDPAEAQLSAGLDGTQSLLIIGFESADLPQGEYIRQAVEIARQAGGQVADEAILISDGDGKATGREGAVGAWRQSFIGVNAGVMSGLGLLSDTFETSTTWDNWPEFDTEVRTRVGRALTEVLGEGHTFSCRFTHVYPDGPAPYYSFSGPASIGGEHAQWQEIKSAASEAVVAAGGTVTHHHAVGRMHKHGYTQQMPALQLQALKAVKKSLDPNGILNPGVLIDA